MPRPEQGICRGLRAHLQLCVLIAVQKRHLKRQPCLHRWARALKSNRTNSHKDISGTCAARQREKMRSVPLTALPLGHAQGSKAEKY